MQTVMTDELSPISPDGTLVKADVVRIDPGYDLSTHVSRTCKAQAARARVCVYVCLCVYVCVCVS